VASINGGEQMNERSDVVLDGDGPELVPALLA